MNDIKFDAVVAADVIIARIVVQMADDDLVKFVQCILRARPKIRSELIQILASMKNKEES
jgi:hypothetical protein